MNSVYTQAAMLVKMMYYITSINIKPLKLPTYVWSMWVQNLKSYRLLARRLFSPIYRFYYTQ